jgi:hypothetical protein
MPKLAAVVTGALVALTLAGCDEGGAVGARSGQTKAEAADPDDAVALVRRWDRAFVQGNGEEACAFQSEDFTMALVDEMEKAGFVKRGSSCEHVVTIASKVIGAFGRGGASSVSLVSAESDAAMVQVAQEDLREVYRVEFTDGQWLVAEDLPD